MRRCYGNPVLSVGLDDLTGISRIGDIVGSNRTHPGGKAGPAIAPKLASRRLLPGDAVDDHCHDRRLELPGATFDLDVVYHWLNSTNSMSVPPRSPGWTKAILAPRPPARGSVSMSRAPCSARWASAASIETTA